MGDLLLEPVSPGVKGSGFSCLFACRIFCAFLLSFLYSAFIMGQRREGLRRELQKEADWMLETDGLGEITAEELCMKMGCG